MYKKTGPIASLRRSKRVGGFAEKNRKSREKNDSLAPVDGHACKRSDALL